MSGLSKKSYRDLEDFAGIASDWFWETDADHRFCYFSAKMQEVTKFNPNELLGRKRDAIRFKDMSEEVWNAHLEDLKARRPFRNFEYQMRRPHDDSLLWVRISGDPEFCENGDFLGYRGTGHDITHERLSMRRLEATNAALADSNKQLRDLQDSLKRSAFEDPLTALYNRRAFEEHVETKLAQPDTQVTLLHIDLDRFKWVNDTLGHPAGDFVLQTAASRIKLAVSDMGNVYRLGGDEFAVISRCMDGTVAHTISQAIVTAMMEPIEFGQRRTTVRASIGVAIENTNDTTPQRLIGYADAALYEAKRGGRNAVCIINDTIKANIDHHRGLAADILDGLESDAFLPHFQPQVDTRTGEVIGVEALVRWAHPDKGLLPPGDFFAAAREQGLMQRIDRIMMQKSIAAVNRIRAQGLLLGGLSINLSEARLMDPNLINDVKNLWADRSFTLTLELLETIYFDESSDTDQFIANIARLRDMGVQIDTDDFGSGRASLTGLLKVRPDRLKIDRCLIKKIVSSPVQRNMVSTILEMAKALGIDCIAEGVETADCVAEIESLGCYKMQGYAIARPMDETALIDFLKGNPLRQSDRQIKNHAGYPQTA